MDGLRTTRVLVIDNKFEEAQPFMEALAKGGIGSIYFSGKAEDEAKLPSPEEKLTGIRLAALDMDLADVGGEARTVVRQIIGLVDRLMSPENGPYLAIAWTSKDSELVSAFREQSSNIGCPPVKVIEMNKVENDDPATIFRNLKKAVDDAYPLGLLSFWEQSIHDSSGSVMQVIPRDLGNASSWTDSSIETLRLLLKAAAGDGTAPDVKLFALLAAFNAIQLDAIEARILLPEKAKELLSPLEKSAPPDPNGNPNSGSSNIAAKLNRRLWFTGFAPGTAPGNVYDSRGIQSSENPVFPPLDLLLEDMQQRPLNTEEQEGWVPIAMEVTPLCDYQHGKRKLPRFVCGIAVPTTRSNLVKNGDYLRRTGPIEFEEGPLNGDKIIVWNSHYIVSAPEEVMATASALVRLRQSNLIDVQAWLSTQGNRPGYLSIGA